MKTLNDAQVKQAMTLKPFLPLIQEWMDVHVKGPSPVSSTKVFAALEGKLDGMKAEQFQPALSLAVRGEIIKGFAGQKGRYGGYIPASLKEVSAEVSTEDDTNEHSGDADSESNESGFALDLGNGFALIGADTNNWKMTRPSGPPLYFTTFERACERAADLAIDAELKSRVKNGKIKMEKGQALELLVAVRSAKAELTALIADGLAGKLSQRLESKAEVEAEIPETEVN